MRKLYRGGKYAIYCYPRAALALYTLWWRACQFDTPKVMLVVLYAVNVIHEKEKGVPCMECFLCAFAFGSYFRVWSLYKNFKNLKNLFKNFLNLGFPARQ